MAASRTSRMTRSELKKSKSAQTVAIAELLHSESTTLLELYKKKERFTADLTSQKLVSTVPPSSQQEPKDKLWCLHSALLQCHSLMERAISREKEELGDGTMGAYENQRKLVKDRLALLLVSTKELLRAAEGGAVVTPSAAVEINSPTVLFELKVWVYRIFKEVVYWSKMTSTTLQEMPVIIAREQDQLTARVTRSIRTRR